MADPKKPVDPQQEVEMQIGELEERVDRLRAMYEQYFMGYEKLEPTVPRRDVDRRFTNLRKINIRNTALRFRFNVVTQKFNTYAMYWTRICRQIEEGTFKRHVIKANKRFGPGTRRGAEDFSIDIDLEDFEVDMDDFANEAETASALADAEAYAAKPSEPPPAPVPQPAFAPRVEAQRLDGQTDRPARPAPLAPMDDRFDTVPPSVPPPGSVPPGVLANRVARHAVLPAGLKQRVLVKKGPTPPRHPEGAPASGAPTSGQTPPPAQVRPRMPSTPEGELPLAPQVRPRMPSTPDGELPSTSVIRASTPHGHVHRSPAGVIRPPISPSAASVQRISVAKQTAAAPAGAGANPPPSAQRIPAAGPNPALGRPPSSQGGPAAPPARAPVPSVGRVPIGLPSSVNRVPVAAPPSEPKTPAPAPPQSERNPMPPPSRRAGPMPAAPRATPSSPPESERAPASRRPPPALPSQLKKE